MTGSPDAIAFCWRPVWFNRFESLWSLLRKFAYFNAATAKNLQDHLSAGAPARYAWASAKRLDLRCYGGFDATRLARLLHIDQKLLDESTILPFLAAEERDVLASNHVRFCVSCFSEGFHSSIHQILLITDARGIAKGCRSTASGVMRRLIMFPARRRLITALVAINACSEPRIQPVGKH